MLWSCHTENGARPVIAATPTVAAVIPQILSITPLHHASSQCCGVGSLLPLLRLRQGIASITALCSFGETRSACYDTSILATVTVSPSKLGSGAQPYQLGFHRWTDPDIRGETVASSHMHVSPAGHSYNYRRHLRHTYHHRPSFPLWYYYTNTPELVNT